MSREPKKRSLLERACRAALRLHPPSFRARHGREMEQSLEDALRAERTWSGYRACLWRFLWDTLRTLPRTWSSAVLWGSESGTRGVALAQDARYAARGLRRDPRFTATAVATLALAIWANASMVGVIDRTALRGPEHVDAPDELVRIYTRRSLPDGRIVVSGWQPYSFYDQVRGGVANLSAVAATAPDELHFGIGVTAYPVPVAWATHDVFTLSGAQPALGRFYGADEDRPPRGTQVAVLGYGLWQREYDGDAGVLGRSIRLDNREFVVIGVAPRGFTGVGTERVDAWLPISARFADGRSGWDTDWVSSRASIVGRLSGPTAAAETELTDLLHRSYDGPTASMLEADVELYAPTFAMDGTEPRELALARLLAALALGMLIIAAANMANLVLARATRRSRELGVRAALGAGRSRIVRLVLLESVLVAALGGGAGFLLHSLGGRVVERTLLPDVPWNEIPAAESVALWTALAALLTGLLAGLVPAAVSGRAGLAAAVRGDRRDSSASAYPARSVQGTLQVVQLALSLVLLFTAGTFVKSVLAIEGVDLGYDADRVVAVDVSFPAPDSASAASLAGSLERERGRYLALRTGLARVPGVEAASVAYAGPLSSVSILRIRLPSGEEVPPEAGVAMVSAVSEDYFATVGTPIVRGEALPSDARGEPIVAISESLARLLWPGRDAVDRCLLLEPGADAPCLRVVGVAADTRQLSPTEASFAQIYLPWGDDSRFVTGSVVLVRTAEPIDDMVQRLRAGLEAQQLDLRWATIGTWREALDPAVRPWRVTAVLFSLFGALMTGVAALGLFSVASYLTALRWHEFGVRIVMGAHPTQVLAAALGSSLRLAVVGIALGTVILLAIRPALQPLLFENHAWDPGLLSGVAATLLAVVLLAALAPSWRATRVDPVRAIRAD